MDWLKGGGVCDEDVYVGTCKQSVQFHLYLFLRCLCFAVLVLFPLFSL